MKTAYCVEETPCVLFMGFSNLTVCNNNLFIKMNKHFRTHCQKYFFCCQLVKVLFTHTHTKVLLMLVAMKALHHISYFSISKENI